MATFVCIHGARGWGSDWDLLAAELEPLGHEVVAVDLPCDQEVGLSDYVAAVIDAGAARHRADRHPRWALRLPEPAAGAGRGAPPLLDRPVARGAS